MNAPATIDVRRLSSPGPIADKFLLSRAFVCTIIGPVGSAKTVTALRKLRRVGQMQGGRVDSRGRIWRKARVGVIRESYPNLRKNTLPSWFRIHPEEEGKFSWDAPFSHKLRLILAEDGAGQPIDICDIEIEFRAIGDRSVEEVCRGWEVNAVMIDEADLQPSDLIAYLAGRVGRFSELDPSLVVDPQIILSLNAPYTDNWVYRLAVEKELGELLDPELAKALNGRPLVETFIQPGGREPDAENLHNLPGGRGYYLIQAALNKHKPGYVERMIDNKFVPMQHGQPVYADFRFDEHVAKEPIEWNRRRKLIVGVDQGLFAAAVFCQRTAMGELRTLGEVVIRPEAGNGLAKIGPSAFGKRVKASLAERFPDLREQDVRVVADPAAFAAADRTDHEHDWVLAFQAALGFKVHRAKSNKEALRLEAIRKVQGERGGYQIDPSCKQLIRGHLGGYRYRDADMGDNKSETRGHLEIADTVFTHVCDAEQYAALEGEHVIADIRGRQRAPATVFNDSGYNELGDF